MTANKRDSAVPSHPSNRNFIRQMTRWGWVETGKAPNNYSEMTHRLSGVKVHVRAASFHDGNPASVFNQVYDVTCNGDSERFWRGPGEPPQPAIATSTAPAAPPTRHESHTASNINKVRDYLFGQDGTPRHVRDIATPTGLTELQVSGCLTELTRRKQVVRLGKGTYVIAENMRSQRHVHTGDVGHHGPVEIVTAPTPPTTILGDPVIPMPPGVDLYPPAIVIEPGTTSPMPVIAVESVMGTPVPSTRAFVTDSQQSLDKAHVRELDEDGTIEAMLDLLSPTGFKAKHLRAIGAWQEATRQLIRDLQS